MSANWTNSGVSRWKSGVRAELEPQLPVTPVSQDQGLGGECEHGSKPAGRQCPGPAPRLKERFRRGLTLQAAVGASPAAAAPPLARHSEEPTRKALEPFELVVCIHLKPAVGPG